VRFVLGGGDLGLMMAAARNRADFLRSIPLETK
jgi:phosphoribosylaminoimidazole carboxylase (NCAIR synthetase)